MPGLPEWGIILLVFLIVFLFGGKKLPELARSLGKSSKEFKKGLAEGADEETKPATEAKAEPPADKTE